MARFLLYCLGLTTPTGNEAFLDNCREYGTACVKSFDRETALKFHADARKILKKTFLKHSLVNAYCKYAVESGGLGAEAVKSPGK
ncbi:MAG: hypothetical protein JW913_06690 [Chitinispirillaceae bacterium]|nr:hypothetical protein [Chitinispirillaceae bacterium]